MPPAISVILPVYNTEPYIDQCLQSILNQTFGDLEVIAIDDCGQDQAMGIVEGHAAADHRIRIIRNDKNHGVAYSRNKGIHAARGRYLSFIDSDDSIDLDFYQKLYSAALEHQAEIVKADFVIDHGDHFEHNEIHGNIHKALRKKRFVGIYYTHILPCSLILRDLVIRHRIEFPALSHGEDIVFLVKALLKMKRFSLVDDTYYRYYNRLGSASKQISERYFDSLMNHYDILARIIAESNLSEAERIEFWHHAILNPLLNYHINLVASRPDKLAIYSYAFGRIKRLLNENPIYLKVSKKYQNPFYDKIYHQLPTCDVINYVTSLLESSIASHGNRINFSFLGLTIASIRIKSNKLRLRVLGIPFVSIKWNT
jgi:glycosyltransferase involved in cell wall biosynthesis